LDQRMLMNVVSCRVRWQES